MNHAKKQGFTLIELMLAMAFIAMLLLAIALIILQISTIYNRGLTIKEAVQASSAISSDLSQDIAAAPTFSLAANAGHYVTQPWGVVQQRDRQISNPVANRGTTEEYRP
jgi:prepilin-type N-terminal cleavage/methylation domain-containing protein